MSSERAILTAIFVLFLLTILNLAFLDFKMATGKETSSTSQLKEVPLDFPSASSSATCGAQCQAYIDLKLSSLKSDLVKNLSNSSAPTILPPQLQTSPTSQISTTSQPKEVYIPFGVNGSSQSTSWVDISASQIQFNQSNYPGARAFYFDVNLQSDAPDKTAYTRIYDSTHGVGVTNSEINYTGLASQFKESSPLNFSSGTLTLTVQVHSLNGNFAIVNNPRVKVVY